MVVCLALVLVSSLLVQVMDAADDKEKTPAGIDAKAPAGSKDNSPADDKEKSSADSKEQTVKPDSEETGWPADVLDPTADENDETSETKYASDDSSEDAPRMIVMGH
ncbi:unnamed protein product [Amaranthus hypochondriacus]